MSDLEIQKQNHPIMRAISLAEALLCECDEHGFVFAAIDASSALDKLNAIKDRLQAGWLFIAPRQLRAYLGRMSPEDAFAIFDSLNDKQHETLMLAARHLTSKQIAQHLGLAPVTIDKRIEGVRSRLDGLPRTDLLRLYREWSDSYDRTINGSIILEPTPAEVPNLSEQPSDLALTFGDNLVLDARAPWERQSVWLQPGIKPSDLGVGGKLLAMLLGAVAIMAVAVLCMAFVDALTSMVQR